MSLGVGRPRKWSKFAVAVLYMVLFELRKPVWWAARYFDTDEREIKKVLRRGYSAV